MPDIATVWDPANGIGDWVVSLPIAGIVIDETGSPIIDELAAPIEDGLYTGGGILLGDDLITAVLISLFTDATASEDDVVPDLSDDPRGWWGDLGAERSIGSKIWLRLRARRSDTTLALVKDDIERALDWLVDDGVAARVDVAVEWSRPGTLGALVTIRRTDGRVTPLAFDWAWKEI